MDLWQIILGVIGILIAAFAGGKLMVHNKIKQLRELARSMDEALQPEGPGGESLTKEEILDIWMDFKALVGF